MNTFSRLYRDFLRHFALGLACWLSLAGSAAAVNPGVEPHPPLPPRAQAETPSAATATSSPAASAPAIPSLPQNIASAPPSSGSMLQVILSLLLVLGLLVLVAWALKRFGPQTMAGGANVKIVGGISLGGRERVLVLEIGEQWIVVGAAPGRVSALATMPKQIELSTEPDMASEKNFSSWLKQIMEKRNGV